MVRINIIANSTAQHSTAQHSTALAKCTLFLYKTVYILDG